MNQRSCMNCEFGEFFDNEYAYGVCRKRPPVVILTATGNVSGEFPTIAGDDWCGKFKVREEDIDGWLGENNGK